MSWWISHNMSLSPENHSGIQIVLSVPELIIIKK